MKTDTKGQKALVRAVRRWLDNTEIAAGADCWNWTGYTVKGYGRLLVDGRNVIASRFSWILFRGPISKGLFVCHRCDNPLCQNPGHLFLGSACENNQDRQRKGRGRTLRGEQTYNHKISREQAAEIRQLWHNGKLTIKDIAAKFGVSITTVSNIANSKSWVTPESASRGSAGGERRWAKLTVADVLEIRRRRKCHASSYAQLASEFAVSIPTISEIVTGKTWKHIGGGQ